MRAASTRLAKLEKQMGATGEPSAPLLIILCSAHASEDEIAQLKAEQVIAYERRTGRQAPPDVRWLKIMLVAPTPPGTPT